MPLNKEPLPLSSDPQSAKAARVWVGDVLEKLGRVDLIGAAELGVSELVTNAILHADPPITVRVRGTRDHPRVEVHDHSTSAPEVNVEMAEDDHLLSTIGRGLGIVALYSTTWGSDVSADGKTVWFEPAATPRTDGHLAGSVFDFSEIVAQRVAASGEPEERVRVQLLGMPVRLFAQFRSRYDQLRRELLLLSLGHGADYPVAGELAELTMQVEQERRQSTGGDALTAAINDGLEQTDLDYLVPASAPASMGRLLELLERADAFCRDQRLLALAASPEQLALQRWYLGEFVRQGAGGEPVPWPGGPAVEDAGR